MHGALQARAALDTVRAPAVHDCARARRGGRVVEGARLESVYTVMNRIVGSNPTPSATHIIGDSILF